MKVERIILLYARTMLAASLGLMLMMMNTGCMTSKVTSPEHTAVEQMLISTAASRAMTGLDLNVFRGKIIFVDTQYLGSYHKEYVVGILREALMAAGVQLVEDREKARIVLEPRSAALSLDEKTSLIGIPSMQVPLTGGLVMPELALYKKTKQMALGSLAVHGYDPNHELPPVTLGPAIGRAYYSRWWFLFSLSFRTTDIAEL